MIRHLFFSPAGGSTTSAQSLHLAPGGVTNDKNFGKPGREALVCELELLAKHQLEPGATKENIVIEGLSLHSLPVGTPVKIGSVDCVLGQRLSCSGEVPSQAGERGVFVSVVGEGDIAVGDAVSITGSTTSQ